jgi:hypothetical protein
MSEGKLQLLQLPVNLPSPEEMKRELTGKGVSSNQYIIL